MGLEILLYIYLGGLIGVTSHNSYECEKNPPQRVISKGECHAIGVLRGVAWPVVLIVHHIDMGGPRWVLRVSPRECRKLRGHTVFAKSKRSQEKRLFFVMLFI